MLYQANGFLYKGPEAQAMFLRERFINFLGNLGLKSCYQATPAQLVQRVQDLVQAGLITSTEGRDLLWKKGII